MSKMRAGAERGHARVYPALALLLGWCSSGQAATLSSQSSVSITSQYASNPLTVVSGAQPAESVAVSANLPATYTSDTQTLDLIPQFRYGETHGPLALLSNYAYLDGDWHWRSERNTFSATAQLHHDSTLYGDFENAALLGRTLARRYELGSVAWDRALSERSDLQLSASWNRVDYSGRAGSSVSDFSYLQGSLAYDRRLSERMQWSTSVGYGSYRLADGAYGSKERFAKTSLNMAFTERWSGSAEFGYTYLSARSVANVCCELEDGPSGPYLAVIPVSQTSSRGTPNYAVTLEHNYQRLVLDLGASRAIQPSGFGALLTQDDVGLSATMPWTERLTLGGQVHWSRLSDSLGRLNLEDRHYYRASVSAEWQCTQYWALQLDTAYERQYLLPGVPPADGIRVSLSLSRQFGRLRL